MCCAKTVHNALMSRTRLTDITDDDRAGPYDPDEEPGDLWFLPDADDEVRPLKPDGPQSAPRGLIDGPAWRAAEAALAADLTELAFDAGRLAERVLVAGPGAVQRLAQAEASSLSWDRSIIWGHAARWKSGTATKGEMTGRFDCTGDWYARRSLRLPLAIATRT